MTPRDVLIESINVHMWQSPREERDPETLLFADQLIEDLKAADYEITRSPTWTIDIRPVRPGETP